MTTYRLKPGQETIDIVDGDHAGKRFERGKTYTDIPTNEAHRFEKIEPPKNLKSALGLAPDANLEQAVNRATGRANENIEQAVKSALKAAEKTETKPDAADNTTAPYGIEPDENPDRKNGFKIVKR